MADDDIKHYLNGLEKLVTGSSKEIELQRCIRAFEAIKRIAEDMLDEERRRGPAGDVCCVQEGRGSGCRNESDVEE